MDLNRITLIGRMGSDPTPKTVGDGEAAKQVVSFRFAVNSPFDDNPAWLTIECWGGLSEVVKQLNLKTGSRLYLEGKLVPDKTTGGPQVWLSEKGDKKSVPQATFVIWADKIIALEARQAE